MVHKFSKLISKFAIPVIQAPMAGGINNPHFVSEVINNGGIGSFGFGYSNVTDIERNLTEVMEKTNNGPINANFFIYSMNKDGAAASNAISSLKSIPFAEKLSLSAPMSPYHPELDACLEPIWRLTPQLLTFHFGIPSAKHLKMAKNSNIMVGVTATTVDEALQIRQAGADFVVAQGVEAGGHRGSFDTSDGAADVPLSTIDLVREIRAKVGESLPIVAAGGVMSGGDIHAMLKAGAAAVQMGTAFLACDESSASAAHKRYILNEHSRGTVYTSAFSGRPAQCIRNEFVDHMQHRAQSHLLPFPLQNSLTAGMRKRAVELDDGEYQSMYVGSRYPLARALSTRQLMAELRRELEESRLADP